MSLYSQHTDLELSDLLKQGDHAAYTEIYRRFSAPLYVHAYNKLRDREEARDLIQELFTSLWNSRATLNLGGHLSAYLYTSVRNRVFRVIERLGPAYHNLSALEAAVSQGATDHLVRENMLKVMIDREIDALPPKMREVFLLSRRAQLSHREIAEQLDISEATVKKQVNNALKILRGKLGFFHFIIFWLFY